MFPLGRRSQSTACKRRSKDKTNHSPRSESRIRDNAPLFFSRDLESLTVNVKPQERLSHDDLVPFIEDLRTAGQQPATAIDECAIRRPEIFYQIRTVSIDDSCMPSRDLGIGVVSVEVDVRENTVIGVPTSDVRFLRRERKLCVSRTAPLDREFCVSSFLRLGSVLRTVLLWIRM